MGEAGPTERKDATESSGADQGGGSSFPVGGRRARAAAISPTDAEVLYPFGGDTGGKRIAGIHVILLLNTIVIGLLAAGYLGFWRQEQRPQASGFRPQEQPGQASPEARSPKPEAFPAASRPGEVDNPGAPGSGSPPGVSWKRAEESYRLGRYAQALEEFRAIHAELPGGEAIDDYLQFRIALSLHHLGQGSQAMEVLGKLLRSDSPAIRAAAGVRLAALELQRGQLLPARLHACQAAAALGGMSRPLPLEADCDFLVARALTEKALALGEEAESFFVDRAPDKDVFAGLDELSLRGLLADGMGSTGVPPVPPEPTGETPVLPESSILGPQIRPAADNTAGRRWDVSSRSCPVENLLSKIGSASGMEIKWAAAAPAARARPVSLSLSSVSAQRVAELACGSVGLIARFTGDEIVVHDPQSYDSSQEQRQLATGEAVSAWLRFFTRFPEDRRIAQGHYGLASLYQASGQTSDAMRQFQVVAQRFPAEATAPLALLASAKARIALRDFPGARNDLLELLDRYAHAPALDEVYLRLGQVSEEAGLLDEAIRSYQKLHRLDLSSASRAEACLGAGRCYARQQDHKQACQWLSQFLATAPRNHGQRWQGYFLLGKSRAALGQADEAAAAFSASHASQPPRQMRAAVLLALAEAHERRRDLPAALGAVNACDALRPEGDALRQYVRVSARVYRAMGLPDKALSLLEAQAKAATDPQLKALLAVEAARCHLRLEDYATARTILAENLPKLEGQADALEASCDLAEACLKLGSDGQAVAVCTQVLKNADASAIRQRASETLGSAYLHQRKFELAALALSDALVKRPGEAQP